MDQTKSRKGWLKSMIVAMVFGVALGFAPQVESQVAVKDTCHDGECQLAGCGDTGTDPCTYMDCGNGTEMCTYA